ncbi:unnamed protein product [Arctia plantaginis]|uniref:Uncharacterized protein n=1 Tax=Arctia plantaginis TaxID=874455 RepID=A0A8S1BBV9_ARCPL|nr:unnamed protein product [Arctia plantaginis]
MLLFSAKTTRMMERLILLLTKLRMGSMLKKVEWLLMVFKHKAGLLKLVMMTKFIEYTADENRFVSQGDCLPTSPIPEEILKALEQNARDKASDIYDDDVPTYNNQQQFYNTNTQPINYNEDYIVTNSAGLHNAADFIKQSVQKTYLPPLVHRNQNQRNGKYNARNGYTY